MTGFLIGLKRTARKLRGDRAGVGAVEFALIAPVLIILYMGSLEISVAMSVNKKLARASSTVADLVTQLDKVDKATLQSMLNVAQSVMTPFRSDGIKVKITGISINGAGVGKATWSWQEDNTAAYTAGSTQSLPKELAIPNTFLVRTEVEFDHKLLMVMPGVENLDIRTLHMKKTYHLRQRVGENVACGDC
ncbi:MAG: pilus assembly protein [Hoeflea sp.]|uniref:TadE/TadG family type IV pilus assembly protein n=1 Tax=Hoeflea sp. TaxID=1940281 RepID=UPI001DF611D9|nr:pilus assembly protein [Hoeflea sp.]MBU4531646.1 pilus assembly protein [Alphaproteobacteria bacterium]MBU4544503.1 pilus assembly protein [Alphaproteobacteria bacterium]MBU4552734.1 pilus assembly protein [Alphaproteobacteria bacterium]MBV1724922.1 pilus assembly protein [Hoeflea sp.]MBV1760942.1 pilus assembly protein [Hoeflea sp.]